MKISKKSKRIIKRIGIILREKFGVGKSDKCTISGGVEFKQSFKYCNMLYFKTTVSYKL